jgi:hypothetical protein
MINDQNKKHQEMILGVSRSVGGLGDLRPCIKIQGLYVAREILDLLFVDSGHTAAEHLGKVSFLLVIICHGLDTESYCW